MSHNHSNKAPGTRRTKAKADKNHITQSLRAGKKETQRKKRSRYWKNNKAYQVEQAERLEKIKSKKGYEKNIDNGIREKVRLKKQKAEGVLLRKKVENKTRRFK